MKRTYLIVSYFIIMGLLSYCGLLYASTVMNKNDEVYQTEYSEVLTLDECKKHGIEIKSGHQVKAYFDLIVTRKKTPFRWSTTIDTLKPRYVYEPTKSSK